MRRWRASPTGACSPAVRASRSSSSTSSATRSPPSPGSRRRRTSIRRRRCATIACAIGSATCRSCARRRSLSSTRSVSAPGRATSRTGGRCRPSSDSTLTVSWPFGTLRPRTRRRPGRLGSIIRRGRGRQHDDQIRTGAAHRGAEPASLSARRGEYRQRHPGRDRHRDGARRPGRAARLRRLLGEEPSGAHRAQSAHRRPRRGREEIRAVLQDRQGNARAAQPPRAMIRKLVSALILIPLAVILVAFAVANRQTIVVSLDPFDEAHPALVVALPLFALALLLVIAGVIIGGLAAWLKQSKWRRAARIAEREARELRAEVDRLRSRAGLTDIAGPPQPTSYGSRLRIPPPAA